MNAGASINSKHPATCIPPASREGKRYVEASPEGLPFMSCLKFRRESTLSPVMPEILNQASTSRRHSRNLQSGIQRLLNTYGPRLKDCRGDEEVGIQRLSIL